ncbi:MAG: helix-turn-helix domain-containing protein [Myxococcales bacterium]
MAPTDFDAFCARLGQRVRRLRERRGLTQEDMMDRGFSLRHYQRIEAGRSVTLRTVWKLARAFGLQPRDLLPRV